MQLAPTDGEPLVFQDGPPPWPRYRLTNKRMTRHGRELPVAELVGYGKLGTVT